MLESLLSWECGSVVQILRMSVSMYFEFPFDQKLKVIYFRFFVVRLQSKYLKQLSLIDRVFGSQVKSKT